MDLCTFDKLRIILSISSKTKKKITVMTPETLTGEKAVLYVVITYNVMSQYLFSNTHNFHIQFGYCVMGKIQPFGMSAHL